MTWSVLKVRDHSFSGDDGRIVSGKYLYVAPADGESSGDPKRYFVPGNREKDFAYFPTEIVPGLAGLDWPWLAGTALFAIMLFCLFKLLGGIWK